MTTPSPAGDDVQTLRIGDPARHWTSAYMALVPAIHPPTTHDREDLIQVWLKLPADGRIGVRWLEDQQRHTLVYPDGTVADRVEYFYLKDDTPRLSRYAPFSTVGSNAEAWSVADVRGVRIVDGQQRFHVYRPSAGEPHVPLVGWSWRRGDADARRRATELLVAHAITVDAPQDDEPMTDEAAQRLAAQNDCAGCHVPNRPRIAVAGGERAVERATDAMGFIVPNAVLLNRCVIADHRPEDVNAEDPFVSIRCGDGDAAELREDHHGEHFVCADGSQPRGHRDVAGGLAAGHPYTRALCESRRALYRRMTTAAREAFAEAFASCGIP